MNGHEAKPVRRPGPDHPISIEPHDGTVTVSAGGHTLARSSAVLIMHEAAYAPVFYIPRSDVAMPLLTESDHQTYCPYKGNAGYFSVTGGRPELVNCVWTYNAPYPDVALIASYLAFYSDRVDIHA